MILVNLLFLWSGLMLLNTYSSIEIVGEGLPIIFKVAHLKNKAKVYQQR